MNVGGIRMCVIEAKDVVEVCQSSAGVWGGSTFFRR